MTSNTYILSSALTKLKPLSLPYEARDIRSDSRIAELVFARAAICLVLRQTGYSLPKIGKIINRKHTSVMHLLKSYPPRAGYVDPRWSIVQEIAGEIIRITPE